MTGSAERTFSIATGVAVCRLGDEVLVYVEASFETHLLSWSSGMLVEALNSADAPCTSQKLQDLLFTDDSVDERDEGGCAVDGEALLAPLLAQLLNIGVISARPC